MKQFKVLDHNKELFIMQWDENLKKYCIIRHSEEYDEYFGYFQELLKALEFIISDIDLVLNVAEKATYMTLYLKDNQLELAQSIKEMLVNSFPDDIEQISIVGNELNILDFFYEYNA